MLADGHVLFRRGLKALLSTENDMEVVAESAEIAETVAKVQLLAPDVVVIDLTLLEANQAENQLALRQVGEKSGLLFVTQEDTKEKFEMAIAAGARGYMLRGSSPAQLVAGIRQVGLSDEQNPRALSRTAPDLKALAKSNERERASVLTLREQEVMRLLAEGRTVREVAAELALSIKTIEAHKLNLMRKLDIHNRASLIESAVRMGLYVPYVEPVEAAS
jgi:DNA-binding NarL/FixJ family response regulator